MLITELSDKAFLKEGTPPPSTPLQSIVGNEEIFDDDFVAYSSIK